MLRGGEAASRLPHKQEIAGANPAPATNSGVAPPASEGGPGADAVPGARPAARVVLALDLASVCGWACGSPELLGLCSHGTLALPTDISLGRQYSVFADWLADAITVYEPTEIVIEAPFLGHSLRAARKLFTLTGIAQLIAYRRDLPEPREYAAASVRKTFCGSGKADKKQVMAECVARGFQPKDFNAADALALLHHACAVTP